MPSSNRTRQNSSARSPPRGPGGVGVRALALARTRGKKKTKKKQSFAGSSSSGWGSFVGKKNKTEFFRFCFPDGVRPRKEGAGVPACPGAPRRGRGARAVDPRSNPGAAARAPGRSAREGARTARRSSETESDAPIFFSPVRPRLRAPAGGSISGPGGSFPLWIRSARRSGKRNRFWNRARLHLTEPNSRPSRVPRQGRSFFFNNKTKKQKCDGNPRLEKKARALPPSDRVSHPITRVNPKRNPWMTTRLNPVQSWLSRGNIGGGN